MYSLCGALFIMFTSKYEKYGKVDFPKFSGLRIMMMPFHLHDMKSIPSSISQYKNLISQLCKYSTEKSGVAYLTIDEQVMDGKSSQRRPGLHVDGVGGWGGGGGAWGASGMLLTSNKIGCKVYSQEFSGSPGIDGDCEHLRDECLDFEIMEENTVYWCDGMCVHESVPTTPGNRQLVRLSLPSNCPWYEGYTKNPKGVLPTGPILPQRKYQKEKEVVLAA